MTYSVTSAPGVFVDYEPLSLLRSKCEEAGTRAILIGFNEYSKHLINWARENIVAVYDPNPLFRGKDAHFRGVPIIDLPHKVAGSIILSCEYRLNYDYLGDVIRHYQWMPYYYPPRLDHKPTHEINVFEQEMIYQEIFRNKENAPLSMMGEPKIKFLLELLRTGLRNSSRGCVVEMGSWQGGSAWFIARTLRQLGEQRKFFMMDLFESHMMDPTATMCTDEIRLRLNDVYNNVILVPGLVDAPEQLSKIETPICFAHIDLGCQEQAIAFAWDNLLPGCPMVLDNYGHLAATTWRFDDLFDERQTRVTRLPWSEQGIIFKP